MAKVNLVITRCTAGVHGIPGQLDVLAVCYLNYFQHVMTGFAVSCFTL
jgi:hypothetical protein